MRRLTLIAVAAIAVILAGMQQVAAQYERSVHIGLKGGITIPNLQPGSSGTTELNEGYSSRLGPYFGGFADFRLSKYFSIQTEINFAGQGGKKNGNQAIAKTPFVNNVVAAAAKQGVTLDPATISAMIPGNYVYANYDAVARINYLEIPVLAKFNLDFGKRFTFVADAGPYLGILLAAHNISDGSSLVYLDKSHETPFPLVQQPMSFDQDRDIYDDCHKLNIGFQGGVGLQMKNKCGYYYIHVGGNYGFLNIQKGDANGKNRIGAATFALGYALKLH